MRSAVRVVAEMHEAIRDVARPGVTTAHLDRVAREVLTTRCATSNFLGYHGYPAVICASVNDEVVHGIPNERPLQDGDILSIDCGAIINGWHGDAAFTMGVGTITGDAQRLIDAADRALAAAVAAMRPNGYLGDVGAAIEAVVASAGYGSPRDYCGHGIGRAMHESPDVENRGRRGKGPRLEPGVVLAIEPMLIAGGHDDVLVLDDDWTVVTADGSLAAHTEHTVVVTDHGPEILTRL
jgi:methionyl aminopeptidase